LKHERYFRRAGAGRIYGGGGFITARIAPTEPIFSVVSGEGGESGLEYIVNAFERGLINTQT
jgi:hypothetical protein